MPGCNVYLYARRHRSNPILYNYGMCGDVMNEARQVGCAVGVQVPGKQTGPTPSLLHHVTFWSHLEDPPPFCFLSFKNSPSPTQQHCCGPLAVFTHTQK